MIRHLLGLLTKMVLSSIALSYLVPADIITSTSRGIMGQPGLVEVNQPHIPTEQDRTGKYLALYDGQCEVCQAGISWLKFLDKQQKTISIPVLPETLQQIDSRLTLDACLRELHVIAPDGKIHMGWDAVALLARQFRTTWILGVLGGTFPFRGVGRALYRFVASNRYALSKCRGGACHVAKPGVVKSRVGLGAFWSCYTAGLLVRLPLIMRAGIGDALSRLRVFRRTYEKNLTLLNGKLAIFFLNGTLPNSVPLLFGELFTAIVYDGIAIDGGSPKMRRSLARHLDRTNLKISAVVATHAHEEHVGNLNWLAEQTRAPIYVTEMTARFMTPFKKLPFVRALVIGQPPDLSPPFNVLTERIATNSGHLQVIPSPGHCDDHIVLYDAAEKLLLAGDAFMGTYFATPNPDVDSRKWLDTLQRLLELDVKILIEGHGHIHTLRKDIPDFPGVVIRQDPKTAIAEKLEYMLWLRKQIEAGFEDGLPIRAIEATCFPWGKRSSWETCANDECIRMLSLGHFSRTELVRSFVRPNENALPSVYEVRIHVDK